MHKYEDLVNNLLSLIENNVAIDNYRLPTESAIGKTYGVSRQTVRRAMDELVEKGYIYRRQGSGNYCTGILPSKAKNQIAVILINDYDFLYPDVIEQLKVQIPSGFIVNYYFTEGSVLKEKEYLEALLISPPRHLIIEAIASAIPTINNRLLQTLLDHGTKIHFVDSAYPGFELYSRIAEDIGELTNRCLKKLISKNNMNIACILPSDQKKGHDVYNSCLEVFSNYSHYPLSDSYNIEEHIFWYSNQDLFSLRKKQDLDFLSNLVERKLQSCSAIICYSDEIAYWLVRLLYRRNNDAFSDLQIIALEESRLSDSGLGFSFSSELSWSTAHSFLEDKAEVMRIPKSYF